MKKEELTYERLKELLHYDPLTGDFTNKITRGTWAVEGGTAGHRRKNGYIEIRISGKAHLAHRLAWLYMEGFFPKNIGVDHIDRNPSNNRWNNLRLVSQQCNLRNCGLRKDNNSGVKGVYWDGRRKKWQAEINLSGKHRHLGRYEDFDDAVLARLAGEQALSWEGCDSSSPAYKYVQRLLKEA